MFNNSMDSKYFPMITKWTIVLSLWIIVSGLAHQSAAQSLAKPGCSETCSGNNVRIPYPFGIGPNCAINESYAVSCVSSKPYLTQLNMEVLSVSLTNQTVTVSFPVNHSCGSDAGSIWSGSNLAGTPFLYSKLHNRMMLFGCGNAVMAGSMAGGRVLAGCTSTCELNATTPGCHGVGCCEAIIPFYLTDYRMDFTVSRFNSRNCSSAFLADQNWVPPASYEITTSQNVAVVLAWTLGLADATAMYPCPDEMRYLDTDSGKRVITYMCPTCEYAPSLHLESINPYLHQACGAVRAREPRNKNTRAALIGVFTGIGFLLFVGGTFGVYKLVKKKIDRMIEERYFKRNGGLLLKQQLSSDEDLIRKTRIFTCTELAKATDGYNPNMILGMGGQGTVYKGMLTDGRLVAIKKSLKMNESQLEQFINEVVILSQVIHRNVVKLLGCCLETEVPMLVYELIPNGNLSSLIHHRNDDEFPFIWSLRLRIATEVAGALAYLHSATSMPIYHRDIKSSNILLDEKYIAKVADFGTSRSVAIDRTHLTTQVKGTFGYLDPEYFQSSQFTEKSDVYSFGVVVAELLTRKKPVSLATEEDSHLSLATRFLVSIENGRLFSILDPQVVDERNRDEVVAVAKLAQRCLNLSGRKRPTMKEVAVELENIKMSAARKKYPTTSNVQQNLDGDDEEMVVINGRGYSDQPVGFSDGNISWTTRTVSIRRLSFDGGDSGASPLLHDTI